MSVAIKKAGPKIEVSDIANVERQFARHLPDDYKRFLLEFNGGEPETNRFDVPATGTASAVRFFYSILSAEKDDDLVHEQRLLRGRLSDGMLAIAEDGCGNRICLSLTPGDSGTVYFWDHEFEREDDLTAPLAKLAASFDSFFVSLQKFDPAGSDLAPEQVEHVWVDPEFIRSLEE